MYSGTCGLYVVGVLSPQTSRKVLNSVFWVSDCLECSFIQFIARVARRKPRKPSLELCEKLEVIKEVKAGKPISMLVCSLE